MAFIVREATLDDAEQLIALVRSNEHEPNLTTEPGEFQLTVEQERRFLERFVQSDNSVFLVAEGAGEIIGGVGCTGGTNRATRHVVQLGIAVRSDWRAQGVGTTLLTSAIEWAKRTGIVRRLELDVYERNTGAIHLYERLGFEVEGRRRQSFCKQGQFIDSLIMSLLLT